MKQDEPKQAGSAIVTPGPWEVDTIRRPYPRILAPGWYGRPGKELIAEMVPNRFDAYLIVTAVNSHADLLEACEEAREYLSQSSIDSYVKAILEQLEKAIAKATSPREAK